MNYLPTCTCRLVVQHPCQVSFKSMQRCRRSWEDKVKCVKFLSIKGHNSAKICRTQIIFQHALIDLWCYIPDKFHSNPCKDVGGVEKTNFGGTEWQNNRQSKLNAPVPFYGGGIKKIRKSQEMKKQCCLGLFNRTMLWPWLQEDLELSLQDK